MSMSKSMMTSSLKPAYYALIRHVHTCTVHVTYVHASELLVATVVHNCGNSHRPSLYVLNCTVYYYVVHVTTPSALHLFHACSTWGEACNVVCIFQFPFAKPTMLTLWDWF